MARGDAGTVRGRFQLDAGPAIRSVREYRREAQLADETTRRLGRSIHSTFGVDETQRIRSLRSEVRRLGNEVLLTQRRTERAFGAMRRRVEFDSRRMERAIARLHLQLQMLSRVTSTPQVELQGLERALLEARLLRRELNSIGSRRFIPAFGALRGVRGAGSSASGAALAAAAGGFGGGAGAAAARAAAGMPPHSDIVRSLSVGPFSLAPSAWWGIAALGLPGTQALIGGATGLTTSAFNALLGSIPPLIAGGGALATGAVLSAGAIGPSLRAMGEARRAQESYHETVRVARAAYQRYREAIREFGALSAEAEAARVDYEEARRTAVQARRDFDLMLARQPGLRRALRETRVFRREWEILNRRTRGEVFGGIADVTAALRPALPNVALQSERAAGALRRAATRHAGFYAGPEMQVTLRAMTSSFARDLPLMERSLRNLTLYFARLARAATPFFHDGIVWVHDWTSGLEAGSRNINETRRNLDGLLDDFRAWRDLTGAVFRTLGAIRDASAPSGRSLVRDLTETFDRWDAWIRANPEQTRRWFADTAQSTREIASALGSAVGWLHDMADALRPLLDRFAQLVRFVSSLGLVGTPGAIGALVGAIRGGRQAWYTSGATLGGMYAARAGMVPGGVPGVVVPPGMAASQGAAGFGPVALAGAATVGYLAARGRGGVLATPERFYSRYGHLPGARYGAPTSQLGPRVGLLQRGLGIARGALMGALRGFAPVVALSGTLSAMSFPGSLGEKLVAGLSDATLGLIPRPRTEAERADRAAQSVRSFLDQRVSRLPFSERGTRTALERIDREIARLQAQNEQRGIGGFRRFVGGGDNKFFFLGLGGRVLTDEQRKENEERIRLLRRERRELVLTNAALRRHARERADERARVAGYMYGRSLGGAYSVYRNSGRSVVEATRMTVDQAIEKLRKIRPAGVETLGEAALAWAREMARKNPELRGEVDRLAGAIERRFRRMGRRIRIVNGEILTGSRAEWRAIARALEDPVERARQKVMSDFTAIQKKAVNALMAMGFSGRDARGIIRGLESGQLTRRDLRTLTRRTGTGQPYGVDEANKWRAFGYYGGGRARGGIVPGKGMLDTVQVPGAKVAPGEAWIANRHTLERLSRATLAVYGLTAQQLIKGETRPHWMPPERKHALGGGLKPAAMNLMRRLAALGFTPTSTTGGRHAQGSFHYSGQALDYGDSINNLPGLWSVLYPQRARFAELFGPSYLIPPTLMRWGMGFFDPALQAAHEDHIHVALAGGKGALGDIGPLAAGMFAQVRLRGPGMRQPGVPGLLRMRAGDIYAKALETRLNEALSEMSAIDALGTGFSGGGRPSANMRLGQRMMLAAGFPPSEWPALLELWRRESGWNNMARNPSSGAFGIPQALPPTKMPPAAQAGDPAAQIAWGLNYIRSRYGTPSAALAFHNAHNWYARGGELPAVAGAFERGGTFTAKGPTWFLAGEGTGQRRRERVTVTRDNQVVARRAAGIVVQRMSVNVNVTATNLGDPREREAMAENVGELVALRILEALNREEALID